MDREVIRVEQCKICKGKQFKVNVVKGLTARVIECASCGEVLGEAEVKKV